LLKRWISSRKKIVPWPAARRRSSARSMTALTSARVDRRGLLERASGPLGDDPRQRGLPRSGRPVEDRAVRLAGLDRRPQGRARGEQVLLADELVEVARPHPHSERGLGRRHACALPPRLFTGVEQALHANPV
jgi:hypothetical protein